MSGNGVNGSAAHGLTVLDMLDRQRIVTLLTELGRLCARERQVRTELAEILEQERTPQADRELGELLHCFGEPLS